jgi:ABC-2 type transport system ATP-binding protein
MSPPAIVALGLVKRFGAVEALRGVDLEVATGSVFALLGPNGAGKTTTVRVLATILEPDAGTAQVAGVDVAREPAAVRRSIGLAGQFAAVDPNLTGRENLQLIGRLAHLRGARLRARVEEQLGRFGLDAVDERLARTYSGGMRRRLDLAAALIHSPPIVFLDEPTAGLDPSSREKLWSVIAELVAEGTTVLLTTHYLEEADRLADHVAVIDAGRVIATGTSAELKASLGTSAIVVEFAERDRAVRASHLLGRLGEGIEADGTAPSVRVSVRDPAKAMLEAVRLLDDAQLAPTALRVREPTLDDVFLALTGQTSEEGDQTEHDAEIGQGAVR